MKLNIVEDIEQNFKNKVLNFFGVERDLYQLIADRDIAKALELMEDHDEEVENALDEYHPQKHKVMQRPNKFREKDDPYITEKLPRNLQSYINEIELFFLLGQPIVWKKKNGTDEAFQLFKDFLDEYRFNSHIRKAKRLAGAETESAYVFHIYQENGEAKVLPFIAARSTGYKLRPLFDQYGQMQAFAVGYTLKETKGNVAHWDIYTKDYIFYCKKQETGWDVESYDNQIKKIPAVYFRQPKAWAGVEPRLERIEMLDSKAADTNNYFADPIAEATADVIQSMSSPDKPGRLIQLTGEKSRFGYVTPPNGSQSRADEMRELKETVLFDTLTPNFDIEKMRGFGTLTGAAIKNTFAIGYIKRDNRKEDYSMLIDRLKNVIVSILILKNPNMEKDLRELVIGFEFADPFAADREDRWSSIEGLYTSGVASLETVVNLLALTDAPDQEIARISAAEADKIFTANEAKGEVESARQEDVEQKTNQAEEVEQNANNEQIEVEQ